MNPRSRNGRRTTVRRATVWTVALLAGCALALSALYAQNRPSTHTDARRLRGFSAGRTAEEERLEEKFSQLPSASRAEATLKRLTEEPHLAGTEASRRVAEYLRDEYRNAGLEVEMIGYRVLLSYPGEILLERTAPTPARLARQEEPVPGDPSTADLRAVPGYTAYSPSGDVRGQVVYANYGLAEDFQRLVELGVDLRGKIVLVRYGQCFRAVKVRLAEREGAAAVLLYSDPADDGFRQGDPYPQGPWRPESGIERGSVQYTFLSPGDPGSVTAGPDASAKPESRGASSLPRIPALPISWRDAAELMAYLRGSKAPREWQGGMPVQYHVGPGPTEAHLKLAMQAETRTIYDVVGRVPGETADWVLAGNHHDAWVFGAADPGSGTAVLLEMARSLGALKRAGWTPRRTILLCSWDAEEFGLLGSTAWVEQHQEELEKHGVAYINMDIAVIGERFGGSASPSLRDLVREAARDTADPRTGKTVYERWRERAEQYAPARNKGAAGGAERVPTMSALGSGSDYSAFYQHAGIASMDISSTGEYGVYHSIYDDFDWMKKFGDPDFSYHVMMTRLAGRIVMRLADADVPGFDFNEYGTEVTRLAGDLRSVARGAGARDPRVLDLRSVEAAAATFQQRGREADEAVRAMLANSPGAARAAAVTRALAEVETSLLSPRGLTGRPWYRHTFSAPGMNMGYAAVAFPGVRDAIERRDWAAARQEAEALREALERAAGRLREATRLAQNGGTAHP